MLKFKMCKYILTAALCWKPQVTVLKILATILTPPPPTKKNSLFMISLITFDDFNFKVVSYIFLQVGAIVWIFFFAILYEICFLSDLIRWVMRFSSCVIEINDLPRLLTVSKHRRVNWASNWSLKFWSGGVWSRWKFGREYMHAQNLGEKNVNKSNIWLACFFKCQVLKK